MSQIILALIASLVWPGMQTVEDADYKMQGEYSGTLQVDGQELKLGIQVIALGDQKFTGVAYVGGLPGDGWNGEEPERIEKVAAKDGVLELQGSQGSAIIQNGVAKIETPDEVQVGELARVVRKSKTLGMKPPADAKLLFGSKADSEVLKKKYLSLWSWRNKPAQVSEEGWLKQGTASVEKFQDHTLHIEFLLPYKPKARGQGRGNSGLYLQGRYEVQMLDSFGLTGEQNECGGIYSIKKPDLNMCYAPMQWQTYDVEFHAAKFEDGKKVANAWMTVKHNGVTIHEKVELPKTTTAAPVKLNEKPGPIYLQDHKNEVRYRNIWVKAK